MSKHQAFEKIRRGLSSEKVAEQQAALALCRTQPDPEWIPLLVHFMQQRTDSPCHAQASTLCRELAERFHNNPRDPYGQFYLP